MPVLPEHGPLTFNGHSVSGPTARRPQNVETGQPFFDTTLMVYLVWNGTDWQEVGSGTGSGDMLKTDNLAGLANRATARNNLDLGSDDDVSFAAGNFSGTVTASNGLLIGANDVGTVSNSMLAGSIPNNKLLNSSITVNGQAVSLGASATITANTPNALTFGTYLTSGGTFDGGAARTVAVDAASSNTAGKVVARDGSGDFAAGTITATFSGNLTGNVTGSLTGNASTATTAGKWTTARSIASASIDGSGNITHDALLGVTSGANKLYGFSGSNTPALFTIGTDIQAFDADLAAIAALSGTNNIYYRSAANTWSSVTIGSGLSFSGGTLSATGGGVGDPAGSDTQGQFNDGGVLAGNAAFTFDKTTGTVTATIFAGSGASLTSLNASNLSSGTLPDARFPATLPAASGINLTAINGSNIASGTVANARLAAALSGHTYEGVTISGSSTPTLAVSGTTSVSGTNTGDQTLGSLGGVATTTTVNGKALSSNITLGLASSDFANQGTTTTLLHGNGSGNPSFGQIVNADITNSTIDLTAKVTGILPTANGGTANAFFTVAGPATSAKTYTLPNSSTTIVTIADTGSVTNTMLAGSIAYSKLSLTGAVLNADLAGSIAASKITTGTSGANIVLANGANTWLTTQTFTAAPVFTDASGTRSALGLGTAAVISATAGGDLSGTLPSPTVTKINGTALSGLATGLLKNTTSTGVPSIATAGTDYIVPGLATIVKTDGTIRSVQATLAAAVSAASSTDTIMVGPGTYNEKNLLKNGVNWYFAPGAIVAYSGAAYGGIFDDSAAHGANAAITCKISGFGTFRNAAVPVTAGGDNNPTAVVWLENPSSNVVIEGNEFECTGNNASGDQGSAVIWHDGGTLTIKAHNRLFNSATGQVSNEILYWTRGTLKLDVPDIVQSATGSVMIYLSIGAFGTASGDAFINAENVEYTGTGGCVVLKQDDEIVADTTVATWLKIKTLKPNNDSGSSAVQHNGGKLYLDCQKAFGTVNINNGDQSNTIAYLNFSKIENTNSGRLVSLTGGTSFGNVTELKDIGGSTAKFEVSGGTHDWGFSTALANASSTGDTFKVTGGALTLHQGRVTAASGQKALNCTGGTLTVGPGVMFNLADVSGITYGNFMGRAPTAGFRTMIDLAPVSGGIPYGSSTSAVAYSSALTANALMIGGGTGAAPSTTTTGTGVLTALGNNIGSAGAPVTFNGALGTPSSGTVTNLTGTASININGTVGATTPAAGTFTTATVANTGLKILDTNASNVLILAPGSDLTADRTLTITTGDASRSFSISGTSSINQDVRTTATPIFAAVTTTAQTDSAINAITPSADGQIRVSLDTGRIRVYVSGWQDTVLMGQALGTPLSGTLTNCNSLPAASVVAGALVNGMTATTQTAGDRSTKLATTAFVPVEILSVSGTDTASTAVNTYQDFKSYTVSSKLAANNDFIEVDTSFTTANQLDDAQFKFSFAGNESAEFPGRANGVGIEAHAKVMRLSSTSVRVVVSFTQQDPEATAAAQHQIYTADITGLSDLGANTQVVKFTGRSANGSAGDITQTMQTIKCWHP